MQQSKSSHFQSIPKNNKKNDRRNRKSLRDKRGDQRWKRQIV